MRSIEISRPFALFLVVSAALTVCGGWAPLAKPSKEFMAARAAYQKGLKQKTPSDRVNAVAKLVDFPTVETSGLVLKSAFADKSDDVRKAAADLLSAFLDQEEVSDYILDQLKMSFRKEGMESTTYGGFRVLARSNSAHTQDQVLRMLEQYMGSSKTGPTLVFTLIDDLGLEGDLPALDSLKLFSKARLFEIDFGFRRAIVQALAKIKEREAIPLLISLIPTSKGLIQHDVVLYLTSVTKQPFRNDTQRWEAWWEQNKDTFTFGTPDPLTEIPIEEGAPTYYRIPITARKIVFVIDTSHSMRGAPLDAAKRELISAIRQLPEATQFSIIVFNAAPYVWQQNLIAASTENKSAAIRMVETQDTGSQTASFDALEAAFYLKPEMIFFLSDGQPTSGKVVIPEEIVAVITKLNFTRRVSLNTIGIGTEIRGVQMLSKFMRALSENNWGIYRAVDN